MHKAFSADRLDIAAFARAGTMLSGTDPLQNYKRLAQDLQAPEPDMVVAWQAQGEWRMAAGGSGDAWLHLRAQTVLPLICQRCMGALRLPLAVERWFRFVADETIALAEDDEAEEDILVLQHDFDLRALIEDELLMALPLVPRHETCPVAVSMQAVDTGFAEAQEERPNPFAALEALRKKH